MRNRPCAQQSPGRSIDEIRFESRTAVRRKGNRRRICRLHAHPSKRLFRPCIWPIPLAAVPQDAQDAGIQETSTERVRALRERRKALGLCRDCGKPVEPDGTKLKRCTTGGSENVRRGADVVRPRT